jgi:hypothetical protein
MTAAGLREVGKSIGSVLSAALFLGSSAMRVGTIVTNRSDASMAQRVGREAVATVSCATSILARALSVIELRVY